MNQECIDLSVLAYTMHYMEQYPVPLPMEQPTQEYPQMTSTFYAGLSQNKLAKR